MVGVAGVDGNGQRELVDALLGLSTQRGALGSIRLHGVEVIGTSPGARRRLGLAVIPADRNVDGVCRSASIAENLVATCFGRPPYSRAGLLHTRTIAGHARRVIERFGVRGARPAQAMGSLSGGTMQRLVVARELEEDPSVLIAAYPTRGVDIRAAQAIRRLLLDLRARGRAVVLISEDLGEITDLCDRVIVLFEGRIVGECPVEQVEPRLLGRLMMGQESALREAVRGAL
jgi:simple sugar transport system ATP-binding protein